MGVSMSADDWDRVIGVVCIIIATVYFSMLIFGGF
jgi:hypothetical protein